MKQKTTRQLVQDLSGTVQDLSGTVQDLSETVKGLVAYTVKGFGEVNKRIDELEENSASQKSLDKVYNLTDQAVKELKTMREEQSAHRQEHDDIDERLNNIEAVPAVAHELKRKSS